MDVWNLNNIYDFKKTNKILEELKKDVDKFVSYRPLLNNDLPISKFLEIVKLKEKIAIISSKISAYGELALTENTSNPKWHAHCSKINDILTDNANRMMFFSLWFKSLDDKTAKKYIKAAGKNSYMFEHLRLFKPYTLSEKEEQIINLKDLTGTESLSKIYDIIYNRMEFKWGSKKINKQQLINYTRHKNPAVRKKAYKLLFDGLKKEDIVFGEIYRNIVLDWKNENIKLRGFKTPIQCKNLSNDISDEIIETILNLVQKNSALFQEYFALKGKILGLKRMTRYDIYAPYNMPERKYTYQQAKSIVLDTWKKFSKEAYEAANLIFKKKHVHSKIQKNKMSGAFCSSVTNEILPYILLNFTGKRKDVFTMMHEFGHGIHSVLARNNTIFTFQAALPLAETASTFGEILLAKRMLKESKDDKERMGLLMELLDDHYATIQRQAYFVIYEKKAHEIIAKGATLDELKKAYYENLKSQFGESLEIPKMFENEFTYIPHIYHTPFYCYSYTFGGLLVLALYRKYEKEGRRFVPNYLRILKAGGSMKPENILKQAGINIKSEKFWQGGFEVIKQELKELRQLVEKKK